MCYYIHAPKSFRPPYQEQGNGKGHNDIPYKGNELRTPQAGEEHGKLAVLFLFLTLFLHTFFYHTGESGGGHRRLLGGQCRACQVDQDKTKGIVHTIEESMTKSTGMYFV